MSINSFEIIKKNPEDELSVNFLENTYKYISKY
jgi:hypothetical protein